MAKVETETGVVYKNDWCHTHFPRLWDEVTGVSTGRIKMTKDMRERWQIEVDEWNRRHKKR